MNVNNRTVIITRAGITIDDEPFYLLAGQLHYFRYPRAEWRNLLQTAKAGGLNTIDTVIPWNFHAPAERQHTFAEDADLAAYLDLCAELGLYAIVRPGPYICAEWENGGFPAWLTALPGVELRVDNALYLEHMARWFDALFPILVARQHTRGGPIILCQIENEHWASGRYGHDDHQRTLARMAAERGMELPQYTCMGPMDEWAEFRNGWSGIAEKLVQTRALWHDNPLIVSELWSGWFDSWGASRHSHKTAAKLDITLHQLLAVGASGFSHWMWAGGTNFDEWGGRTVGGDSIHMTTSYDYDAPVSEYGGLTEKYYVARRHHLFLETLGAPIAAVLADAVSGGPRVIAPAAVAGRGEAGNAPYRNVRAASSAPAAWRDFTATYLQNNGLEGQTYQLYLAQPDVHLAVEVEAASLKPLFRNLPLGTIRGQGTGGRGQGSETQETGDRRQETGDRSRILKTQNSKLKTQATYLLEYHTSRVLGFWERAGGDVLVLYGGAGEVGELALRGVSTALRAEEPLPANVSVADAEASVVARYWISERPTLVRLAAGERTLTVVLLTTARATRWWPVAEGFVCGPKLVTSNWKLEIGSHAAWVDQSMYPFFHMDDAGTVQTLAPSPPTNDQRPITNDQLLITNYQLPITNLTWAQHDVVEHTTTEGWQPLDQPRSFDELGCYGGYGWYRAEVALADARRLTLAAPWLSDRARVLVDGVDRGWLGVHPHGPRYTLDLDLPAGAHDLRLLVDNLGRFNYGSNTGERKGLLDTLYAGAAQHDLTGGWTALWQEAVFAGEALANAKPAFVRADAANVSLASFAFQGPNVWLLREFTAAAGRAYLLHLTGDRNPGALFVNGANVARFSRHNGGGYVKADLTPFVRAGSNVIALNITGYAGAAWRATLLEYDRAQPLAATWSFRAGVGLGDARPATNDTQSPVSSLQSPVSSLQSPCFYRAIFAYDPATHGAGPFKLYLGGLRKGRIWLNGRGVGRYWQIGPQEAYKLPASWMQPANELLIFEEERGTPEGAEIGVDALGAASLPFTPHG